MARMTAASRLDHGCSAPGSAFTLTRPKIARRTGPGRGPVPDTARRMSHPGRLRRHVGMRIAIAGGTGTLGRHLTAELSSRGHEVRVLSRSAPEYRVDLATGEGLEQALRGCDVV